MYDEDVISIRSRVVARAIDLVIVGIPLVILALVTQKSRSGSVVAAHGGGQSEDKLTRLSKLSGVPTWVRIVIVVVVIGYELAFAAAKRPTFGKRIMRGEVVAIENRQIAGVGRTLFRMVIPLISLLVIVFMTRVGGAIVIVDALFALPSRRVQTLHDRLAATLVVVT
jgi:uncharacterized RDD family membrane protein YckC